MAEISDFKNDETVKVSSKEALADAIMFARDQGGKIELIGTGTRQAIGNLMETTMLVDLSDLEGITLYEPEELVLSARAGTRLSDIKDVLAEKSQMMAFEPPDLSHLLGTKGQGTLGGMVACGYSGPRRVYSGAVRDHVLGVKAVSGHGEFFKTGGRVVKNVTGYDLSKILTGSWGTLAAMTELTIKVLPRPETENTLVISGLSNERAMAAMSEALQAPVEVSGAAHLPEDKTVLRLEGFEPSVKSRIETLKTRLGSFGDVAVMKASASQKLWSDIGDVRLLSAGGERPVWRICVTPSMGAKVLAAIEEKITGKAFFDWGGGLIWLEVLEGDKACAAEIRGAVKKFGGHATLVRASEKSRAGSAVFQPQCSGLAKLAGNIKASFDPDGVLNPGRMFGAD